MLLQSHAGELAFLPALPAAWPSGAVTGLRARGAIGVDLRWQGGRATSVMLRPAVNGDRILRPPRGQQIESVTLDGKPVDTRTLDDGTVRVSLLGDRVYQIAFR